MIERFAAAAEARVKIRERGRGPLHTRVDRELPFSPSAIARSNGRAGAILLSGPVVSAREVADRARVRQHRPRLFQRRNRLVKAPHTVLQSTEHSIRDVRSVPGQ